MTAKIVQHGFGGPGEERTAVYLRDHLPDGWWVICGRQLASGSAVTRDCDFIVMGPHSVTVVEEKSWRGAFIGSEQRWYDLDRGSSMPSPLNQANDVARVLAGKLNKQVPGLKQALAQATPTGRPPLHLVDYRVILSSPRVRFDIADARVADRVLHLEGCEQSFLELDARYGRLVTLGPLTAGITTVVTGLPDRPPAPRMFGDYRVLDEFAPTALGRRYVGEHPDGRRRLLLVYERPGVTEAERKAADHLTLREYHAMVALAPLGRVFAVDPYFGWDDHQLWVVPVHLPAPEMETLRVRVHKGQRPTVATFLAVAADAFAGLADLHARHIVHRALHPSRVWFDDARRSVVFSDLLIARIADQQTVLADDEDLADASAGYRAPECRAMPHAAIPASDVWSLAACLAAWWRLQSGDPGPAPEAPADLPRHLRDVLGACFEPDPNRRPTAASAAETLTRLIPRDPPPRALLAPGATYEHYEIIEEIGRGSTSTTWLVLDTYLRQRFAMKVMQGLDSSLDHVLTEMKVLTGLTHERIMGVFRYWPDDPPALLAQYIDGDSLAALGDRLRGDAALAGGVLTDVLTALGYAHRRDVLHRDVSPSNIVIDSDGHANLIDFGVAALVGEAHSVVGTRPYLAPEVESAAAWSPGADLYAVAVAVFEALTGRRPYATDGSTLFKHQMVPATADEEHACGKGLLAVLLRGAHSDPDQRFSSAAGFLVAAEKALRSPPIEALLRVARVNPAVDEIRQLYRNSALGNQGNRGLETDFAARTYVPTRLDEKLVPLVLAGGLRLVVFSGNPGDGKTAFLERLGAQLVAGGGETLARDAAGWRMTLGGHEFASVLDASESHDQLSSDELLHAVLGPLNDPARRDRFTALIAANDGRLLDFFSRESVRYPDVWSTLVAARYTGSDRAVVQSPGPRAEVDPTIAVVDLKRRSLASLSESAHSVAERLVAPLLAPERWMVCDGCVAAPTCPILGNVTALREARAADRLHRLVLTSHLRRGRRPTIRDLRSAVAYVITADVGCQTVTAEVTEGLDPSGDRTRRFSSAAFAGLGGSDRLLDDWRHLDPARIAAPALERAAAARPGGDIDEAKRTAYFVAADEAVGRTNRLGPYRHLEDFVRLLGRAVAPETFLPPLLRGLSRCVGVLGYAAAGVAVAVGGDAASSGAVVKILPEDQFALVVPDVDGRFVEAMPDRLALTHLSGQARIDIDLDLFELLMRAASGYLPTNAEAGPLLEELGLFRSALTLQPTDRLMVLEPSGRSNEIRVADGAVLELVRTTRTTPGWTP